jgi:hypothetical protein
MSGPALVVEVVGGDYRVGRLGQEIIKNYLIIPFLFFYRCRSALRVGQDAGAVIAAYARLSAGWNKALFFPRDGFAVEWIA